MSGTRVGNHVDANLGTFCAHGSCRYYQDADKEYYEYYGYYADDDFGYGDDYYYEVMRFLMGSFVLKTSSDQFVGLSFLWTWGSQTPLPPLPLGPPDAIDDWEGWGRVRMALCPTNWPCVVHQQLEKAAELYPDGALTVGSLLGGQQAHPLKGRGCGLRA
eukprot:1138103-Pelagomonas_calceolata.AAC.3